LTVIAARNNDRITVFSLILVCMTAEKSMLSFLKLEILKGRLEEELLAEDRR